MRLAGSLARIRHQHIQYVRVTSHMVCEACKEAFEECGVLCEIVQGQQEGV